MKKFACVALGLLLVSPVWAEDESETTGKKIDPKGLDIVKKVDEATKAVTMLQYEVDYSGWGEAEANSPKFHCTFWVDASASLETPRFRAEVKGKQPQSEEEVNLTAGGDGETYFLIDHTKKAAYEDIDPAVMGRIQQMFPRIMMREYTHPTPFSDEINGDVIEIVGEQNIGGEPCHEIRVVYAGGQGEATWCFSKNDHLPRKRFQKFTMPGGGEGGFTLVVTNLKVNPKFDDKTFKLVLPEGYEKTDDFAP